MTLRDLPRKALKGAVRLTIIGFERGPHVTRHYMYEHLAARLRAPSGNGPAPPRDGQTLSISHSLALCEVLGFDTARAVEANFPEVNMLDLPYSDGQFSYVVSDQVLEHIEGEPQRAIDESLRVLRPGGIGVHTTCLVHPIHECPKDFWRFTPDGLRFLCRRFSEIVDCGGWGNPYVWLYIALGLRFDGVPTSAWHPVHRLAHMNDPNWPVVTCVVARK